jgi:hypothetical protein
MEKYYFFIEPVKILANRKINYIIPFIHRITTCKKHADNIVTTTYKYATELKKSANEKPVPGRG